MTTTQLDFEKLPKYEKRKFVSDEANLRDQVTVVAFYEKLLARDIKSTVELEQWLLDRSEMESAVSQAGDILYIRMTCQTDDQARAEAFKNFIETVVPAAKPLEDQLNKKYLVLREKFPLDPKRYEVYDGAIRED